VNEYKEPILDSEGKLLPGVCPECLGKKKIIQKIKMFKYSSCDYKKVPCKRCGGSGSVKIIGGNNERPYK